MQEIYLAEESSRQNATQLNSQEKLELNHSKMQMMLQLARWMAHTGQGTKADITGILKQLLRECFYQRMCLDCKQPGKTQCSA